MSTNESGSGSSVTNRAKRRKKRPADVPKGCQSGARGDNKRAPEDPTLLFGPELDGGLTFERKTDSSRWDPELCRVIAHLVDNVGKGLNPLEYAYGTPIDIQVADFPSQELGTSDLCLRGSAWIKGASRERVEINIHDRAFVVLNLRTGKVSVRASAFELYSRGARSWCFFWLSAIDWLTSRKVWPLEEAHSAGWSCTDAHIFADFQGLLINRAEVDQFTSSASARTLDKEQWDLTETNGVSKTRQGTIYLGQRSSECFVAIYNKTLEREKSRNESRRMRGEQAAREDDAAEGRWRKSSHFVEGLDVVRVEVRLRGRGLKYEVLCKEVGGSEVLRTINLRDPVEILCEDNLRMIWRHLLTGRRLSISTSADKRHAATDERWRAVIDAAEPRPSDEKQRLRVQREIATSVIETRKQRAARTILRKLQTIASLGGLRGADATTLRRAIVQIAPLLVVFADLPAVKDECARIARRDEFVLAEEDRNSLLLWNGIVARHDLGELAVQGSDRSKANVRNRSETTPGTSQLTGAQNE